MAATAGKCGTCWGHGLWADGTAPMGRMDASDGLPTMPCPECSANPNPVPTSDLEVFGRVVDLLLNSVTTDGAHHKQWHLEQIAEALGVVLPDHEAGVAP